MLEEISATLGIDIDNATPERVAKRAYEYAIEMTECYEADTLEYAAFTALATAIQIMRGGK